IEVDFVVAKFLADLRSGGEIIRSRPAELQRYRMLAWIETEQPPAVTMNDGAGRQHLRIEPRAPTHQTVEDAAMPVRPIHHGCHGKAIVLRFQRFTLCSQGDETRTCALQTSQNCTRLYLF